MRPSHSPTSVTVVMFAFLLAATGAAAATLPCQVVEDLRAVARGEASLPRRVDRDAVSELVQQLPGTETSASDLRLGELFARLNAQGNSSNCGLTAEEQFLIRQAARVIMGGWVPGDDIRLGDLADKIDALLISDGQATLNLAQRLQAIQRLLAPVSRAGTAVSQASEQRLALQRQYADVENLIHQLRRQGVGADDTSTLYQAAYNRLLAAGRDDLIPLLDGHRTLTVEVAAIDDQAMSLSERTQRIQEARRFAFGPVIAKDIFEQEEVRERYEIKRRDLEAATGLSPDEKSSLLGGLRKQLKIEQASSGSFVGFVNQGNARFDRLPTSLQQMVLGAAWRNTGFVATAAMTPVSQTSAVDALATTTCELDAKAVNFEATVDPSVLENLLASLPSIALNRSVNIAFAGLCVTHHVQVRSKGQLPLGGSQFTVTPTLGRLRVDLDFGGSLSSALSMAYTGATGCNVSSALCNPLGTRAGCNAETTAVAAAVGQRSGSISASAVRVTQIAETCVLADCKAVHPLESTNATLSNFAINLFGSCAVSVPVVGTINPCATINSLVTTVTNWLVDFEGIVEGFFVDASGKGLLIEVFHNDIVTDGCSPIPETGKCLQAVMSTAGMARAPRSGGINGLLYIVPVLIATGVAISARRRRRVQGKQSSDGSAAASCCEG